MKIEIRKFGTALISRPTGKEAAAVMLAYFRPVNETEPIELDFEGVVVVAPSWLDEVLTALRQTYGKDRVKCLPTQNTTVIASLNVIDS